MKQAWQAVPEEEPTDAMGQAAATAVEEGNGRTGQQMPKSWLLRGILCGGTALVLLFAVLLGLSVTAVRALDPTDYQQSTPEGFRHAADAEVVGKLLELRGWTLVVGQSVSTVDCYVVLYDTQEEKYWRLPTQMEIREDLLEDFPEDNSHVRGGFYASIPLQKLGAEARRYELCFAYRTSGNNNLIHTGRYLDGKGGGLHNA